VSLQRLPWLSSTWMQFFSMLCNEVGDQKPKKGHLQIGKKPKVTLLWGRLLSWWWISRFSPLWSRNGSVERLRNSMSLFCTVGDSFEVGCQMKLQRTKMYCGKLRRWP
jgi:hypothetical protein